MLLKSRRPFFGQDQSEPGQQFPSILGCGEWLSLE